MLRGFIFILIQKSGLKNALLKSMILNNKYRCSNQVKRVQSVFLLQLITIFAFIFCTVSSFAQIETNSELSKQIADSVDKNWKFECHDKSFLSLKPEILDYMKTTTLDSIQKGIEEVRRINPNFAQRLIENIQNKQLTVSCVSPAGDTTEARLISEKLKPVFKVGPVVIGIPKKQTSEMQIGKPLLKCLNANTLGKDKLKSVSIDLGHGQKKQYTFEVNKLVEEGCRQAIFHEFLHFADADNKSRSEHNAKPKIKIDNKNLASWSELFKVKKLDDVVYACSRTAFRYGTRSDKEVAANDLQPFPDLLSRQSFVKSCMACSLARAEKSRVFIQTDSFELQEQAKFDCIKIYEDVDTNESRSYQQMQNLSTSEVAQ